jgi:hypothetical protein
MTAGACFLQGQITLKRRIDSKYLKKQQNYIGVVSTDETTFVATGAAAEGTPKFFRK